MDHITVCSQICLLGPIMLRSEGIFNCCYNAAGQLWSDDNEAELLQNEISFLMTPLMTVTPSLSASKY